METPYQLMQAQNNPAAQAVANKIKHEMIDEGKMGIATGKGFISIRTQHISIPNF